MKRTKFLALALVVAVMLMGAGYAAWQETLTISHTVSTGNVDVDLANGGIEVFENSTIATTDGLQRPASSVTGSEQTATVVIENLYPGAKAVATIPVTNNSTMPVEEVSAAISDTLPAWLTVNADCPDYLGVTDLDNKSGNIIVTMTVSDTLDVPEFGEAGSTVQFTVTPIYEQWNTHN